MVSPEHINEQKPEDQQAPSPAVEQQVPAVVKKKRPWLKPLMRVASIVLSLVGSFVIVWATFIFLPGDYGNWALLEGLLLGAVGAVLFWSWWAILVIPIAFSLGEFLAFYLISLDHLTPLEWMMPLLGFSCGHSPGLLLPHSGLSSAPVSSRHGNRGGNNEQQLLKLSMPEHVA